jgi:dUTP pyrophosphatase
MINVNITLDTNARIPHYASNGAAGCDVHALLQEPVVINSGETELIPTGIRLEIPLGYEAQIRPRSGLALKNGITFLNSPGTIDSDYRGEVKIIATNLGKEPFTVTDGMRIAQMIFTRVYRAEFISRETLSVTERNDGGFGHSGI